MKGFVASISVWGEFAHTPMQETTVEAYLRRKGALAVLIEIGDSSATFQAIDGAVLVSSSTVSNRLQDGVEKDLVEITHRPTDHGTQKRYTLTRVGSRVLNRVREIDLEETVRQLQRLQRERETELERLIGQLNRDKLVLGYEHERNPPPISEETLPPADALQDIEPLSESEKDAARQERLEDDLIDVADESDTESDDQT